MYIVSFIKKFDGELISDFFHQSTLEDAKNMYQVLLEDRNIYSVSISAIMESSDYDNAPEFRKNLNEVS